MEIQIQKSKSNEITVICGWYSKEKMKSVLKFSARGPCVSYAGGIYVCVFFRVCVTSAIGLGEESRRWSSSAPTPSASKPTRGLPSISGSQPMHIVSIPFTPVTTCIFDRKDKYEKDKIEYWVEEETKGTYKVAESELYTDKREIDATEDCADENNPSESDSDDDNECESDDDESSEDSENSDKKGKKRNAKKSKKAKKDKKQKTKRRARGSPSSKSKDDLEEETPAEAIRSEPTFPKLYIAPRQSFLALPGHRERWRGDEPAPACAGKGGSLYRESREAFGEEGPDDL